MALVRRVCQHYFKPRAIILSRRKSNDWYHTGIARKIHDEVSVRVEGNTSDEGGHKGDEVCHRIRNYKYKDFIRI